MRATSGKAAGDKERSTGRENIEQAVELTGLKIGDTVTATGVITYLSADSKGNVWMRVAFERSWSGVDLWAGKEKP
jgi:hypothetical protein